MTTTISVHHLARIEGHAGIKVVLDGNGFALISSFERFCSRTVVIFNRCDHLSSAVVG